MEMRKCDRGHYYDASIHAACPYCSVTSNTEMTVAMGVTPMSGNPVEMTMPIGMQAVLSQTDDDDGKTIAILSTEEGVDPVVGFLIALSGKNRGRDYRIHSDNNFIGRSEKMDICIKHDDTISRENQAILTFDTGDQCFFLSPGSGRSVIKINGKSIFQTTQLEAYDKIIIGKTELLFLPLCGERFSWEEE